MGREVRMVPANYEHPRRSDGSFIPLKDGYAEDLESFKKHMDEHGLESALEEFGQGLLREEYMLPDTPDSERTHLMMFENTSEGTPISPAFKTPDKLARWLTDNKASAFAKMTATYEQWLAMCKDGYAPSAFMKGGKIVSGVEGMSKEKGKA